MGLLTTLGIRRSIVWETPTLLDRLLESPLQTIVFHLYLATLWLRGNPVKPPANKQPIQVVFLSDTHDEIVSDVPDGDLLIHSGDTSSIGSVASIQKQIDWLDSLPHQHKVLVCGNHDSWFDVKSRLEEDALAQRAVDLKGIHYLERKAITLPFKGGRKLNLFGAPDIPKCGGQENAFQYLPQEQPWEGMVPLDTDILITHTPPYLHCDLKLGCAGLLREIWRVRPTVHVFGHVHCGRGMQPLFWDECQAIYEKVLGDENKERGPVRDWIPGKAWVDTMRLLFHGLQCVAWQWLMLGGASSGGSIAINAGMQDGVKGRLNKKKPFTIEI